jgi:hypothetical protein
MRLIVIGLFTFAIDFRPKSAAKALQEFYVGGALQLDYILAAEPGYRQHVDTYCTSSRLGAMILPLSHALKIS